MPGYWQIDEAAQTPAALRVEPISPTKCENCQREPAAYRVWWGTSKTDVCRKCIKSNEGRPGWPYLDDLPSQTRPIRHGSE